MRDAFAALSEAKKQPHFLALADLLTLYLCTRTWVAATEYRSFRSDPVPIHTCDIPCSCSCTYRIHEGQPLDEDELTMHYDSPPPQAPAASHDHYYLGEEAVASAEEARWSALSEEARLEESNRVICARQKLYGNAFLWYQLAFWYEQESCDPATVWAKKGRVRRRLRSERRGCLQLPNVDYCFQNANVGTKMARER